MHVSVSQLMTWWECPRRWRLSLDHRTPQSAAQQKGDWAHAVVQSTFDIARPAPAPGELGEVWAKRVAEAIHEARDRFWLPGVEVEKPINIPLLDLPHGDA